LINRAQICRHRNFLQNESLLVPIISNSPS
jgi:hypothetical protein